ncbi:MAG: pyridoxamine 5'-phosphate oxidase family protein [Thermomicrobiales bacterium]
MDFRPFADEFMQRVAEIVYCTATTVSPDGTPRSRILHPVWHLVDDRPVGWVVAFKTPVKVRHLTSNPRMACMYWTPAQDTVAIDAVATWVDDEETRREVWELLSSTPEPMGYDPRILGMEDWNHPFFTPLRLDPSRIQMLRGEQMRAGDYTYRVWQRDGE